MCFPVKLRSVLEPQNPQNHGGSNLLVPFFPTIFTNINKSPPLDG